MKIPLRPIRENKFSLGLPYYDHEVIEQYDGKLANFSIRSDELDKGWVFNYFEDEFGFRIVQPDETEKFDIVLKSEIPVGKRAIFLRNEMAAVQGNEQLHCYEYGGVLSKRGGFYITPRDNSNKVLRVKGVWMS